MTEHNEQHEPFVDADENHEPVNEELENHDGPRNQGEKVAEDLKRIATDAAYAAAGFAGFLGDKAREFYDEQRRQYTEAHPESEEDPEAKQFLNQMRDKVNAFFEDLTQGYKDMAGRGAQYFKGQGSQETGSGDTFVSDVAAAESADGEPAPTSGEPTQPARAADNDDDGPEIGHLGDNVGHQHS